MHPELIQLGPITLYSFGLLVALGVMIASLWTGARAEWRGESVDLYFQAIFWILVSGFLGARLMYIIYYPELFIQDPLKLLTDRGGLVWYGGLLSASLAAILFLRWKKVSIPMFGDIAVIPAALGLAIGRLGCFMAGCCYGRPTELPWGVQFPHEHVSYPALIHPTQLYESGALLLLILGLQQVYRRSSTPGETMVLFFVGYGIIRFVIEFLRGDALFWVGNVLTASQVFSLVGIAGGLLALAWLKRGTRPNKVGTLSS